MVSGEEGMSILSFNPSASPSASNGPNNYMHYEIIHLSLLIVTLTHQYVRVRFSIRLVPNMFLKFLISYALELHVAIFHNFAFYTQITICHTYYAPKIRRFLSLILF